VCPGRHGRVTTPATTGIRLMGRSRIAGAGKRLKGSVEDLRDEWEQLGRATARRIDEARDELDDRDDLERFARAETALVADLDGAPAWMRDIANRQKIEDEIARIRDDDDPFADGDHARGELPGPAH